MLESIFSRTLDAYQRMSKFPKNTFVDIPVDLLFPTPDNSYKVCWYDMKNNNELIENSVVK